MTTSSLKTTFTINFPDTTKLDSIASTNGVSQLTIWCSAKDSDGNEISIAGEDKLTKTSQNSYSIYLGSYTKTGNKWGSSIRYDL